MKTIEQLEKQKRDLEAEIAAAAYAARTPQQRLAELDAQIASRRASAAATAEATAAEHDRVLREEIARCAAERGAELPADAIDLMAERARKYTSASGGALVVHDVMALQRAGVGFLAAPLQPRPPQRLHTTPAPARLGATSPREPGESMQQYAERIGRVPGNGLDVPGMSARRMPGESVHDFFERAFGRSIAECIV